MTIKKCKLCGKSFEAKHANTMYCDGPHFSKCPVCGKDVELPKCMISRPSRCCSTKCSHEMRASKIPERTCSVCGKMFKPKSGGSRTCGECQNTENLLRLEEYDTDALNDLEDALDIKGIEFERTRVFVKGTRIPTISVASAGKTLLSYVASRHKMSNALISRELRKKRLDAAIVLPWVDVDTLVDGLVPRSLLRAEDCKLYRLNPDTAKRFAKESSAIPPKSKAMVTFALVCDGEIIQSMSFGKPAFTDRYSAELQGIFTRPGTKVVGGVNRLMQFANKDFGIKNIVAYKDNMVTSARVYEDTGMRESHTLPDRLVYSRGSRYVHSGLLSRVGYSKLFKKPKPEDVSTHDQMLQDGWLPVYDCGKSVYVLDR